MKKKSSRLVGCLASLIIIPGCLYVVGTSIDDAIQSIPDPEPLTAEQKAARKAEAERVRKEAEAEELRMTALDMAQKIVGRDLKAPSTAKWPGRGMFDLHYDQAVTRVDEDEWTVVSYVDSENSFGAMIRTNYVMKLKRVVGESGVVWESIEYRTLP